MFCTQCGTKLDDQARFCSMCGKATEAPVSAAYIAGQTDYPAPRPKRLRRIVSEKKIAGVCAGFAEYFDVDVTLMRIIWLALFLSGVSVIAYFVAWIVLPADYSVQEHPA